MKPQFKLEILLVALVCVGPVVGAYLLYYAGDLHELPRLVNAERDLVDPPVSLPALGARSGGADVDDVWAGPAWTLAYARTSPCDQRCIDDLVRLRQVHLALGRDYDRVQRAYLGVGEDARLEQDRTLSIGRLDGAGGTALLDFLGGIGLPPGPEGRVYLADPHGNLVLSYPPDAEQEGLHSDLKRLLRVSRIG